MPLEAGPESLYGAQAQGLSDRIGDMKGGPQAEVKHGRLHQIFIRHSADLLQEQGSRQHVDRDISSGLSLAVQGDENLLIDIGKNIRRKGCRPGLFQSVFFLIGQKSELCS